MSETKIWQLLETAREDLLARAELDRTGPCFSFERLEDLALNPSRWTDPERDHVAHCRRCARLTAISMRELTHPSVWALLRERLGLAGERERLWVQRHREGECVVCREKLERLPSLQGLTAVLPVIGILSPKGAQGAPAELDERAFSGDERVQIGFLEYEDGLFLDLRASDPALRHQLFGFELLDSGGEPVAEGFAVLHEGPAGQYGASVRLDHTALYESLAADRLARPMVAALELDLLTPEQRERLPEAARTAGEPQFTEDEDGPARSAAWHSWALAERSRENRTEEYRALLDRILAAAFGTALMG